jgi:hypothetical protein
MSKGKVLKNPIAPKERVCSREFVAPTKERATTGRFMSAGDYSGVGFRVNVGTEGKTTGLAEGPIPQRSMCFRPDEAVY